MSETILGLPCYSYSDLSVSGLLHCYTKVQYKLEEYHLIFHVANIPAPILVVHRLLQTSSLKKIDTTLFPITVKFGYSLSLHLATNHPGQPHMQDFVKGHTEVHIQGSTLISF